METLQEKQVVERMQQLQLQGELLRSKVEVVQLQSENSDLKKKIQEMKFGVKRLEGNDANTKYLQVYHRGLFFGISSVLSLLTWELASLFVQKISSSWC